MPGRVCKDFIGYFCINNVNANINVCRIAPVHGASNKEALRFLNAAPQLFKMLDEVEEKQVQDVKDALDKTKNL